MNIQVNPALSGVNWEALLQQAGTVGKASETGEKPVLNLTATAPDGTQRTLQVNIPDDLETPTTVDQQAIDSLCGKLAATPEFGISNEQAAQFRRQLGNALQSNGVTDSLDALPESPSIMFDLYKFMALLVEVAQKQRDSERQLRESESTAEQTAILNQAAEERTDAWACMAASLVCCLIQVGGMLYAGFKEMNSFKDQMTAYRNSGVDSASEDVSTQETADSEEGAQFQVAATEKEVGTETSFKVSRAFDGEVQKAHAEAMEAKEARDAAELKQLRLKVSRRLDGTDFKDHPELKPAQDRVDAIAKAQKLEAINPKSLTEGEARELEGLHRQLDGYATEHAGDGLLKPAAEVFEDKPAKPADGGKAAKPEEEASLKAAQELKDAHDLDAKDVARFKTLAAKEAAAKNAAPKDGAQKPAAPAKEQAGPAQEAPAQEGADKAGSAKAEPKAADVKDGGKAPAGEAPAEEAPAGEKPAEGEEPAAEGLTDAEKKELRELRTKLYARAKASAEAEFTQLRSDAAAQYEASAKASQATFEEKRGSANEKIDAALKPFEDAYETALGARASASPKTPPAEIRRLDGALEEAQGQLKYARARAAAMRQGITTPEERMARIEKAKARVATLQTSLHSGIEYVKAGNAMHRAESLNSIVTTVGGCIQGLIQHGGALGQANTTEEGAKQKKEEEEADELKDLFNQAGDLVKSVLQLMAAVGNAESQSMRDAIQA